MAALHQLEKPSNGERKWRKQDGNQTSVQVSSDLCGAIIYSRDMRLISHVEKPQTSAKAFVEFCHQNGSSSDLTVSVRPLTSVLQVCFCTWPNFDKDSCSFNSAAHFPEKNPWLITTWLTYFPTTFNVWSSLSRNIKLVGWHPRRRSFPSDVGPLIGTWK